MAGTDRPVTRSAWKRRSASSNLSMPPNQQEAAVEDVLNKKAKLALGDGPGQASPSASASRHHSEFIDEVVKALEVVSQAAELETVSPPGKEEEIQSTAEVLVTIPKAEVHLSEDGGETAELGTGALTISRVVQKDTTVAVFAKIGDDFLWPLAKDAPVVKLNDVHYVFALKISGIVLEDEKEEAEEKEASEEPKQSADSVLNYSVRFHDDTDKELLAEFDKVLERYSTLVPVQVERKSVVHDVVKNHRLKEAASQAANATSAAKKKTTAAAWWSQLLPSVQTEYKSALARAIATGSAHLVNSILWVSDLLTEQIEKSGFMITERIKPNEKPAKFSAETIRNVERAKKVSEMSASLASSMLSGVVTATGSIASTLLNTKTGAKLLGMLPGEAALATMDAFVRIFEALELAGKNVMSKTSLVTCQVISHRYGDDAAALTKQGLATAGYVLTTAWTISKLKTAVDPLKSAKNVPLLKSAAAAIKAKGKASS